MIAGLILTKSTHRCWRLALTRRTDLPCRTIRIARTSGGWRDALTRRTDLPCHTIRITRTRRREEPTNTILATDAHSTSISAASAVVVTCRKIHAIGTTTHHIRPACAWRSYTLTARTDLTRSTIGIARTSGDWRDTLTRRTDLPCCAICVA